MKRLRLLAGQKFNRHDDLSPACEQISMNKIGLSGSDSIPYERMRGDIG